MQYPARNAETIRQGSRIGYLDGIRGWAALFVLQHHVIIFLVLPAYYPDFFTARSSRILTTQILTGDARASVFAALSLIGTKFIQFITDGYFFVLVFFVLSGFALSATQLDPRRRNLPLASTGRYFRLMIPILSTTLIAYALLRTSLFFNAEAALKIPSLNGWLGSFYQFHASFKDAIEFATFGVFFNYDSKPTYNSSLWTMPIELQGSLLIFSLLAIFKQNARIQWKIVLVLSLYLWFTIPRLACFSFGYTLAEINAGKVFETTKTRVFDCLCIGCFIIVGCLRTITFELQFPYREQLSTLLATLLILSVCGSSTLRRFFSNGLSRFLGRISFPMYLMQVIVICSWSAYLIVKMSALNWSNQIAAMILWLTTVALCIAISVLLLPVERLSITGAKALGRRLLVLRDPAIESVESRNEVPGLNADRV